MYPEGDVIVSMSGVNLSLPKIYCKWCEMKSSWIDDFVHIFCEIIISKIDSKYIHFLNFVQCTSWWKRDLINIENWAFFDYIAFVQQLSIWYIRFEVFSWWRFLTIIRFSINSEKSNLCHHFFRIFRSFHLFLRFSHILFSSRIFRRFQFSRLFQRFHRSRRSRRSRRRSFFHHRRFFRRFSSRSLFHFYFKHLKKKFSFFCLYRFHHLILVTTFFFWLIDLNKIR
jgi:hypothetical protein